MEGGGFAAARLCQLSEKKVVALLLEIEVTLDAVLQW